SGPDQRRGRRRLRHPGLADDPEALLGAGLIRVDSEVESAVEYPFAPENRARSRHAHHFTADPIRPQAAGEEDEGTGAAGLTAAAGRLRARLHHHPEEAELRAPEGGQGAADLTPGGDRLHPGYRSQPAGALGSPDPRRPR